MPQALVCPHCKKEIELSQALSHQMEEEMEQKLAQRFKNKEVEWEREKEQKEKELLDSAKKQFDQELKFLREESEMKEKKLDEARKFEIELRKKTFELEEKQRNFELEQQRQLDLEREKIRKSTESTILEQQKLKDKEKDLIIDSLKKSLDEAQRKAHQGSQQLQGEVQELDLEQSLRENFPTDVIEPIGKGIFGADIKHIVKSPKGIDCGTIIWESKRTKDWSDGWLVKLKEDMRNAKANVPALVTQTLPKDFKNELGLMDGVWVCTYKYFVILGQLLRKSLLDAGYQKAVVENKHDKAEQVYLYITSADFANQVDSMIVTYKEMLDQVNKERLAFEKSWKQRESQIQRLMSGASGIYGSIAGLTGSSIPTVKNLELED